MELSQCWRPLCSGWVSTWATRIIFSILVSSHSQQIEGSTIRWNGITREQDLPEHVTLLLQSGLVEAAWPETLLWAKQEKDSMSDKGTWAGRTLHHHCFPPLPSLNLICNMKDLTGPLQVFCFLVKYNEAETFGLRRKWKYVPLNLYFWLTNKQGYFLRWPWLNFSLKEWKHWFNFQEN